ncbi:tyrosine-type recombinase/integrase [Streptomyces viridochromogenes]|uniref:tyrosine-type recombinase/integrase n=1 Tax=Streptomyces viridochromogenes TaxID=1938 RepID=UPI001F19D8B2|nr:tyrosine-type recombinase/integrase [Streptomyces viridochromogenes]
MLHPANVTRRFIELYEEIGLPRVQLHDLRHGAATLAHAAGADLKDIQEMLGRSSITITADTYTSLLPETDLAIAEAQPGSYRAPAPPPRTPPPKRSPSRTRPMRRRRSPCRMVLIRREKYRGLAPIRSRTAHANGPGPGVRGRIERLPGRETPGQQLNALCPRQDSNLRHPL